MVLTTLMVVSMFAFNYGGNKNDFTANSIDLPDGLTVLDKISDQDTSNFAFTNVPDIANAVNTIFVNTPANDGRIWTDKSVNANQAFIYDTTGGVADVVQAPPNEFLVTLSALSQSVNTSQIIVEPSDTVFIIDVSGSMVSNTVPGSGIGGGANRTRIAVLVDALNDAIVMMMNASPNNRVSVVIYGGQSVSSQNQAKTYPVLPLGRYEIAQPIFSVSGSTVTVNAAITNPLQRSFVAEGGTPTQLGIRRGADMLLAVEQGLNTANNGTDFDTGIPNPGGSPGDTIIVTRKPNIILMTDGEPTYAWFDHTMKNFSNWQGVTTTANWYDVGNGSAGDMGLTALTVMTASYVKQEVRNHYYGTPATNPNFDATKNVGFYTIGLGVNSTIANGMLDPYGKSSSGQTNAALVTQVYSGNNQNYDMLTVLNNFTGASNNSGQFPYLIRGSSTSRSLTQNANTDGFVTTCKYDTMAFTAMDKAGLDDAFNQITQQIVTQGNYSTNTPTNTPQYDGYLAFSDVIGEYMDFSGFYGVWYNNVKYDASTFGTAIQNTANTTLWDATIENLTQHLERPGGTPGTPNPISDADARALIEKSIEAGYLDGGPDSFIRYYADFNRDFIGRIDEFASEALAITAGARAIVDLYTVTGPAVDALKGTETDLLYLVFQRVTVIEDGIFNQVYSNPPQYLASNLKVGDQIVRWYIPATLIPLREVEQNFQSDGSPEKDDFGWDIIQVNESVPLRVIYSVAPQVDKIRDGSPNGLTTQYKNVNKAPEPNSFYFYTNRWRGMDGTVSRASPAYDMNNMSLAAFIAATPGNPYYINNIDTRTLPKSPNPTGPTGTSPWQWMPSRFTAAPNTVQVQYLGNNGRIMIQAQADLTIYKEFSFTPAVAPDFKFPDYYELSINVNGFDSDLNTIFSATLYYPGDFTLDSTGINGSVTIKVPPGEYSIYEGGGYLANYIFAKPPPVLVMPPPYITAGEQRSVTISNPYTLDIPTYPLLRVRKAFHGLNLNNDELIALFPDFKISIKTPGQASAPPNEGQDKFDFALGSILAGFASLPDYPPEFPWPPVSALHPGFLPGPSITLDGPDLIGGEYFFTETGATIPGYVMEVRPDLQYPFLISQEQLDELAHADEGWEFLFIVNNRYIPITFSLDITKVINGLQGATDSAGNPLMPLDLAFKVEKKLDNGLYDGLQTIYFTDMINNKVTLTGLQAGTYSIMEVGGAVDEFTNVLSSITMTENGVAKPLEKNPDPIKENSYLFTLDGNQTNNINIAFNFTNTYTPVPPTEITPPPPPPPPPPVPPEKSPQTGVNHNITLPIILLATSAVLFGGSEVVRRRYKKRKYK